MKKKKRKISRNVILGNILLVFTLFLFGILIYRAGVLSLSKKVDNIDLKTFSKNHTIKHETIPAKRGNIYDANGDILAQNVYSYTLIAYLKESRGEGHYVKDKEYTAERLATVINMDYDRILALLNSKDSNGNPLYQTEFGKAGRGLTEISKDKIKALNLPGIDFIENQKRYYPKGNFLSYTLGYAKVNEDGKINGEMGIESLYNTELTGTDGFREYQKDLKGYKIADTKEIVKNAEDGANIYLTIDSNIQFFIEQALNEAKKTYKFDELNIVVADAKTGKILGLSSTTSFDPNIKNISTYLDPNISNGIEPGSTMKIYTYMAALESGKYNGNKTFMSGTYTAKDGTAIRDSNRTGWGVISYDRGFALSSNVGICNIIKDYLSRKDLLEYFKKLGFGSKTGIELSKETSGKVNFKYETEIYNAGFGQGILVTPIQNIKALTSIANDGILLKPYIVDRIEDASGKVIIKNERTELGRVASKQTTDKIKDLMETVLTEGTGVSYNMPGYNLIAKTGTAQISSTNGKGYLQGPNDFIRGFAGMFPKENPKIIIYANLKRPVPDTPKALNLVVKSIVENTSKYYNIYDKETENIESTNYVLDSYYNLKVDSVKRNLENKGLDVVVIGNGDTIIDQYPSKNISTTKGNKVFLLTNGEEIIIPNFTNWSRKDVYTYLYLANIKFTSNGRGYLTSQSIVDIKYEDGMTLEINFNEKYQEQQKEANIEENS